ncbi:MAG: shikimate dehydrogenase [Bacteroidales bacterium]|nr:shikimate dehydrogenase [Bacteroidales bacterium]
MDQYGLIGNPVSHSYSKKYFTEKFLREGISAQYDLYQLDDIQEVYELIKSKPDLKGLNVTIPFKQSVIRLLDEVDQSAKLIGAVNTIAIKRKNRKIALKGYNTDAVGFERTLDTVLKKPINIRALILGTGGASKAVKYVFRKKGIAFRSVSRAGLKAEQITYGMLTKSIINNYNLIVNSSPIGMYPNIDEAPDFPYQFLTNNHILIDLIYNPSETLFLHKGSEMGASTANGMTMFINQAEEAWKIWRRN